MSPRSRSHRATVVRRCLLIASAILVVCLTATPRPMLSEARADPRGLAIPLSERRSLAEAGRPGRLTGPQIPGWSDRSGQPAWPPGSAGPAPTIGGSGRVPPLRPPVRGRVVRGFEPPSGPYGPGHRGIDFAASLGAPVSAPAGGRVVFAGPVAGLRWLSVEVAPGVVVSVGPLDRPVVAAGEQVASLAALGRLAAGHAGGLHLGLRVDGVYVDPLPYLVGAGPPRLAPLPLGDSTAAPT